MKEFLPDEQYINWLLFVKACFILCRRGIRDDEIQLAHESLEKFCKGFECYYGTDKCTPNMHLHMHLKKCVEEFGPVYGFWCFSFERFNGVLGSYHTNNRDIGITIMRKFVKESQINTIDHSIFKSFSEIFASSDNENRTDLLKLRKSQTLSYDCNTFTNVLSVTKQVAYKDDQVDALLQLCEVLEPCDVKKVKRIGTTFKRVNFADDIYASTSYCRGQNKDRFVMTRFINDKGELSDLPHPSVISSFYKIEIVLSDGRSKPIYVAECEWLRKHPYQFEFGEYMQIWHTDFERYTATKSFVPLNFFDRKYACIKSFQHFKRNALRKSKQSGPVNFVVPLSSKSL